MKYKRIHIVGIYGSGKSTLAKKLSEKLKYKVYDLDKIKYKREYDLIRDVNDRIKMIKRISNEGTWITEGTWLDYALPLYKKADLVILLVMQKNMLYLRILKRFIRRKLSKKGYLQNTIKSTTKMIQKVKQYYGGNSFITLEKHINYIKKYSKKYKIIQNKKQINEFLNSIK